MEPLTNAMPLPSPLVLEEPPGDSSIVRLLLREPASASEMDLLDAAHAIERHVEEPRGIAQREDAIEGIFVRIECDRALGLIQFGGLLAHDDDDLPRDDRKGSESPRRVSEDRVVPLREVQIELNSLCPADRDPQPPRLPVEPVGLVLRLQH